MNPELQKWLADFMTVLENDCCIQRKEMHLRFPIYTAPGKSPAWWPSECHVVKCPVAPGNPLNDHPSECLVSGQPSGAETVGAV